VVHPEPLPAGHALWGMEHVIITPYMSGDTEDHLGDLGQLFLDKPAALLQRQSTPERSGQKPRLRSLKLTLLPRVAARPHPFPPPWSGRDKEKPGASWGRSGLLR
jgi:hypothetical protein